MPTRLFTVFVAAAATLAVTGAGPGRGRSHALNATIKQAPVTTTGSPGPPVDGTEVAAGTVTGSAGLGPGASVQHVTFLSPGRFKATFTVFYSRGSLKGTDSGTGTLTESGSATFSGTGKVTGGTGNLKGARGSFTFTGSSPSGSATATFKVRGRYRLPH